MSRTARVGRVAGAEYWEVAAITQETVKVDGSTASTQIKCSGISFLPASGDLAAGNGRQGSLVVEGATISSFAPIVVDQPSRVRFSIKYLSEPRVFYIEGIEVGQDETVILQLPSLNAQSAGSAFGDGEIKSILTA